MSNGVMAGKGGGMVSFQQGPQPVARIKGKVRLWKAGDFKNNWMNKLW
jgi:hypothetical protein